MKNLIQIFLLVSLLSMTISCASKKKIVEREQIKIETVENLDVTNVKKSDSIVFKKSKIEDRIIEIEPDSLGVVTKIETDSTTIIKGAKSIKFTNRKARIDEKIELKKSDSTETKSEAVTKIDTKKREANVEKRQFLKGWMWILLIIGIVILLRYAGRYILPGIGIFKN